MTELDKLEALYKKAGLSYSHYEHFNALVTSALKAERRGWSTVSCDSRERYQRQICSCADDSDAEFIAAIINAFPELLRLARAASR